MNSTLEDARQSAEEIDLFESTLSTLLLSLSSPNTTQREKLAISHRSSNLVERIVSQSESLLATFQPGTRENKSRNDEIEVLTGTSGGATGVGAELSEFYKRLGKVKEFHRKYPQANTKAVDPSQLGGDEEWLDNQFSGEEGLGRYLDLNELHESWNNLGPSTGGSQVGGWKRMSYLQFLNAITEFNLSISLKLSPAYSTYLTSLFTYLTSFYERVYPMGDFDSLLKQFQAEFEKKWEAGEMKSWTTVDDEGTWCAACAKRYSKATVYNAHLTSPKHIKALARLSSNPNPPPSPNKSLALKESLIKSLLNSTLASILSDTIDNTERRSALTDKERAEEYEDLQNRDPKQLKAILTTKAEEEEEDSDRIYNPLKLPMGWDGKPIPFWLYKLHGLGMEFKCEICSDFIYMGRKVFEKHFQESRHSFGMRALGLPNTKHFNEITIITDAIALAEKLKQEGKKLISQTEMMEEIEDDEGNVYNRKTYDDLKRQGLL